MSLGTPQELQLQCIVKSQMAVYLSRAMQNAKDHPVDPVSSHAHPTAVSIFVIIIYSYM